jgi:hypothetical protein
MGIVSACWTASLSSSNRAAQLPPVLDRFEQRPVEQCLLDHALGRGHRGLRATAQHVATVGQRFELAAGERGQAESRSIDGVLQRREQMDDLRRAPRVGKGEHGPAVQIVLMRLDAGFGVQLQPVALVQRIRDRILGGKIRLEPSPVISSRPTSAILRAVSAAWSTSKRRMISGVASMSLTNPNGR